MALISRRGLAAAVAAAGFAATALGTPASAAAGEVEGAQRAYAAGHFEAARRQWLPLAEQGDTTAQIGLATLYDLGQGVRHDAAAAYGWYRRAAEAGVADAEFDVAVMLDAGDGVPRDMPEAALWYARAAARGNRRAQYNMGQLYLSGEGVPRNLDAAETWFRMASAAIPAATDKLVRLRKDAPSHPAASGAASPKPVKLGPAATAEGAAGEADTAELVWTPPAQAAPGRYYVQVMALGGVADAIPQEVFGRYVGETATVAPLVPAPRGKARDDAAPVEYAWRVYTVGLESESYAASDWSRFKGR